MNLKNIAKTTALMFSQKNVDDGKLKKLRNHENMYIEKTWKKNQKIDKNLTSKNIVHNGQV